MYQIRHVYIEKIEESNVDVKTTQLHGLPTYHAPRQYLTTA